MVREADAVGSVGVRTFPQEEGVALGGGNAQRAFEQRALGGRRVIHAVGTVRFGAETRKPDKARDARRQPECGQYTAESESSRLTRVSAQFSGSPIR